MQQYGWMQSIQKAQAEQAKIDALAEAKRNAEKMAELVREEKRLRELLSEWNITEFTTECVMESRHALVEAPRVIAKLEGGYTICLSDTWKHAMITKQIDADIAAYLVDFEIYDYVPQYYIEVGASEYTGRIPTTQETLVNLGKAIATITERAVKAEEVYLKRMEDVKAREAAAKAIPTTEDAVKGMRLLLEMVADFAPKFSTGSREFDAVLNTVRMYVQNVDVPV